MSSNAIAFLRAERARYEKVLKGLDSAIEALSSVDAVAGDVIVPVATSGRKRASAKAEKPAADKAPKAPKEKKARAPRVSTEDAKLLVLKSLSEADPEKGKTFKDIEADTNLNYAAVRKSIESMGVGVITVGESKKPVYFSLNPDVAIEIPAEPVASENGSAPEAEVETVTDPSLEDEVVEVEDSPVEVEDGVTVAFD